MGKKSRPINYKATITNPDYTKNFARAVKYELCVTMRLLEIWPKPNCNEKRIELIKRLEEKGKGKCKGKAPDLKGITNAKEFRNFYWDPIIYL